MFIRPDYTPKECPNQRGETTYYTQDYVEGRLGPLERSLLSRLYKLGLEKLLLILLVINRI